VVLEITPTEKQYEAWQLLGDNTTSFLLFGGGAGGGKSFLGCQWLIAQCLGYKNVRYLMARKELKQLKATTLNTFFKICSEYNIKRDIHYIYNAQSGVISFLQTGSEIVLMDLVKKPSDPMFQDLGSLELTGAFIDEAGEIDSLAFDILKSRIGRQNNQANGIMPKILMTCNPIKNWLYYSFFKPNREGTLIEGYKFLQALVTDNNKVDEDYINQLRSITDKVTRQRLLLGDWEYSDDASQLITYDSIIDSFNNHFVKNGTRYIVADIARFGKDKTVIGVWSGFILEKVIVLRKSSITDTAEKIRELQGVWFIPTSQVLVDEDGVGGGVKDILKCKGFVNNSTAAKGEQYINLKSQCYYRMAERMNKAEYWLKCTDTQIKEHIIEELEQVKQKSVDSDGKKAIISKDLVKDILGRSPDYSDMIAYREYFELFATKKIF